MRRSTSRCLAVTSTAPGFLQSPADGPVNPFRHHRIGKAGEPGLGIVRRKRAHRRQALGQGLGDFIGVARDEDRGGIDAGAARVRGHRFLHDVEVFFPLVDLVLPDEDFRVPGPVDLDAGIVFVLGHRAVVAEEHDAADATDDRGRSIVVAGVKRERLPGGPGLEKCLDHAPWRPRFLATWLDDDRDFHGDRRNVERVHRRGIAGHDHAEGIGLRVETNRDASRLTVAAVEDREIDPPGQPGDDGVNFPENVPELGQIHPDQGMRQSAGGRQLLQIILRGLHRSLDAQGQVIVEEMLPGLLGDGHQIRRGKPAQGVPRRVQPQQIPPHQTRIRIVRVRHQLPAPNRFDRIQIQRLVGNSLAEEGEGRKGEVGRRIWEVVHFLATWFCLPVLSDATVMRKSSSASCLRFASFSAGTIPPSSSSSIQ